MQATLLLSYSLADLRAVILQNAPTDAQVHIYRDGTPDQPELLIVVRFPSIGEDADALSWVPHSWSAHCGDDTILHIDHVTLLDIVATHARDTAAQLCPGATGEPHVTLSADSGVTITAAIAVDQTQQGQARPRKPLYTASVI